MKNHSLPAVLLFAVAAAAGCRALPEPVCESRLLVPAVQVTGPRTAAVGQTVTYTLRVRLGNSCGAFDSIVVSKDSSRISPFSQQVGVQGKYTGCSCQADTLTVTPVTYQFRPAKAGTYYLHFLSQQFLTRPSTFLNDTLTVR
ncbi:MAG: hypothetical protein EOO59_05150 [Hymenobacter sp.]|nr:MAG: hypothetical protein EOO59_05150 [Hymenobacter sp.]